MVVQFFGKAGRGNELNRGVDDSPLRKAEKAGKFSVKECYNVLTNSVTRNLETNMEREASESGLLTWIIMHDALSYTTLMHLLKKGLRYEQ